MSTLEQHWATEIDRYLSYVSLTRASVMCYNASHMFGKVKNYAMKKLLEKQLKDVPEDQKAMIMTMIEKDPALFEKIAKELQAEMKENGNNQMAAAQKVLPKYQAEIMAIMPEDMKQQLIKMQMGTQGQFNPNGSIRK